MSMMLVSPYISSFGQVGGQLSGVAVKQYDNSEDSAASGVVSTLHSLTVNTQAEKVLIIASGDIAKTVDTTAIAYVYLCIDDVAKETKSLGVWGHVSADTYTISWSAMYLGIAGTDFTKGSNFTVKVKCKSAVGLTVRVRTTVVLEVGA